MEANVLFLAENLMEQKAGFAHVNEVESSATLNWRSGENSLNIDFGKLEAHG